MSAIANDHAGSLTPQEWERIEREEHDRVYADMNPFGRASRLIVPEEVLRWEDYCYQPGARADRGNRTRRLFELMDIHNIRGLRVLDVGCGIGQYAVFFALMGADVTAFDISPVGIEQARRLAEFNGVADRCRFDVANASGMPYADGSFDIVVYHEVLHHAIKYPNVREETLRVLKPGGRVLVSETLRGNALLALARRISMRGEEAKGDVILRPDDLKGFARGFSHVHLEPMSLLFMLKRVFVNHMNNPAVRLFMRTLKMTDDVLLKLFPSLRDKCGECVMLLRK